MATVEENIDAWNVSYEWNQKGGGEEWSAEWGGSEAQWIGAIYPRVHSFLPVKSILEIAPGFGRWTQYLKRYCQELIGVDLAENCIKACKERFASDPHLAFHVNDGKSLKMVRDQSIDFIFSFDSLVHAETDVIKIYLDQFARKLKPNGVGFIHHSNLGAYKHELTEIEKIPAEFREKVVNKFYLGQKHWRAQSMTAEIFDRYCGEVGLQCVCQEKVNWGTDGILIDCFSTFTHRASTWVRENRLLENMNFMKEAHLLRDLAKLYMYQHFHDVKNDA